jgi:hypothetical protein
MRQYFLTHFLVTPRFLNTPVPVRMSHNPNYYNLHDEDNLQDNSFQDDLGQRVREHWDDLDQIDLCKWLAIDEAPLL